MIGILGIVGIIGFTVFISNLESTEPGFKNTVLKRYVIVPLFVIVIILALIKYL